MSNKVVPLHEEKQVPLFNIANILTIGRLILVPVFIFFLLSFTIFNRWVAFVVFAIAALTDKIDGQLARKYNLITNFGKIADGIADKALILSALVLLSYHSILPWWATILFIVRELGITIMRLIVLKRVVIAAGITGKIKMVLQVVFVAVLLVPWDSFLSLNTALWIFKFGLLLAGVALALAYYSALEYVFLARKALQISQLDEDDS